MAVSYSRIAGLALDADLPLMLRREAHRIASVLDHGAHRLIEVEHEASQACICVEIRSYASSYFNVETRP